MREEAASESTEVVDGAVEIAGRLAGVIESGASIVVNRMSSEFADNLAKRCAGTTAVATARRPLETEGDAE